MMVKKAKKLLECMLKNVILPLLMEGKDEGLQELKIDFENAIMLLEHYGDRPLIKPK